MARSHPPTPLEGDREPRSSGIHPAILTPTDLQLGGRGRAFNSHHPFLARAEFAAEISKPTERNTSAGGRRERDITRWGSGSLEGVWLDRHQHCAQDCPL